MNKGFLNIVLHAHLPYVRHPEQSSFFEENWLFEAMTECYIPLINVLDRLDKDNVKFRLTLSLSPTLISMLADDLLQQRYQKHLNKQIELAESEIFRTKEQPQYQKLARLYRRSFLSIRKVYQYYQGDLLVAFKKYYEAGYLELITTTATHGLLPLLKVNETAVRNQINVGIETFKINFGFMPQGFWLPECGYYEGLEDILAEEGIQYFFMDRHGVLDSNDGMDKTLYAPVDCGNGVLAFTRDPETSQQVWSAEQGYPGNANYREYYSDIGFELDLDVVSPYILDGKQPINTGIKYHRVTGNDQDKQCYDPKKAGKKVKQDAIAFVEHCQKRFSVLNESIDEKPVITSPYDAELFGHWWFEGPCWLEWVLRQADQSDINFKMVSCSDYLKQPLQYKVVRPTSSTWGEGGYFHYWLNEANAWIYPFLHKMADEMEQLAIDFKGVSVSRLQVRALNQAARSLLLAQASDWPFILTSGTTTEYAKKKLTDYLARFNYLHDCIRKNSIDERYLLALEIMDNIFPDIDYQNYKPMMGSVTKMNVR